MATTGERNTPWRQGIDFAFALAVGAKINKGAIVYLDAGTAKPGFTNASVATVGVCMETVDQTMGDAKIKVRRGTFHFNNSAAADELTTTDIGSDCYLVDDETVAKTNGGNARSKAGVVRDIEEGKVWVEF